MNAPAPQGSESMVAARNALTLGTSLAVTGSLALLVRLLIPRVLGPEAFGEYRLAESAAELLFVVLTFGVDAQLRREAALDPARARGYLFGLAALRIAALSVLLRATGASGPVIVLFLLIAASQILVVLNNTYAAFEHATGDVRWIARTNLVTKAAWALALGLVLALTPAGVSIALAALAVETLRFAWLTGRGLQRHRLDKRPDVRLALTAIVASLPFFVNVVAHSLYARIGMGWLAAWGSEAELGLYGAASNLASIALLGMPLLAWVLVPSAARAASRSTDEMARLVSSALRVSLLVIVPVALAFHLAAGFWLRLFFGSAYDSAAPVLRILAPTFALAYASTVCAIAVIQQGRIWTVAAISLAGVVATALLDVLLIPWGIRHLGAAGGAQGAAWATLGTEMLVTVALAFAARPFLRGVTLARTVAALGAGIAAAAVVVRLAPDEGLSPLLLAGMTFVIAVLAGGAVGGADLRFCRQVLARSRPGRGIPVAVEAS